LNIVLHEQGIIQQNSSNHEKEEYQKRFVEYENRFVLLNQEIERLNMVLQSKVNELKNLETKLRYY
jgi:uncharacterized coiled-coil protein SlyX